MGRVNEKGIEIKDDESVYEKEQISPFAISQIFWSMGHVGICDSKLIRVLIPVIKESISKLGPSEAIMIAKSLVILKMHKKRITKLLLRMVESKGTEIEEEKISTLKNMLWTASMVRKS